MKHELDCPHCGTNMIKSYGTETKLRMKLLKWDRNGMFAICRSCSEEVPIGEELLKSIQTSFVYEVGVDKGGLH